MTPLALRVAFFAAVQRNIATAGVAISLAQFEENKMSVDAVKWAWRQSTGLRSTEKYLLIYLADRYNEQQGFAWPSISRMSKDTKISKSSIKRALKRLEELGYIRRQRRFKPEDGSQFTSAIHLPHNSSLPTGPLKPIPAFGWFDASGKWDVDHEKVS